MPYYKQEVPKKTMLLNTPKYILTTKPYTKEANAFKTLKFITNKSSDPHTCTKSFPRQPRELTQTPANARTPKKALKP